MEGIISEVGSLEGRVALVTNGTRGIGRAIALELATRHASVAIQYPSRKTAAENLVEELRGMNVRAMAIRGDVVSEEGAQEVVQQVLGAWNRLDILVNNAGVTLDKTARKKADDEWGDIVSVDVNGAYYCTGAAVPAMIEQRYGRIVNVNFNLGESGGCRLGLGSTRVGHTRYGIVGFTKALAREMAKHNITVNTVTPGFTNTEMAVKIPQNMLEQIRAKIPMGRFAKVGEVAQAVVFLAAQGDYITGQQINVTGGLYM